MFERYTEQARRVLFFARFEASQFGSQAIDGEHLLLALLRDPRGVTGTLFVHSNLAVDDARKTIESRLARGKPFPVHIESVAVLVGDAVIGDTAAVPEHDNGFSVGVDPADSGR